MFLKNILKILSILLLTLSVLSSNLLTVNVTNDVFKGSIVGLERRNLFNETFAAFLGIPYAQAPIGDLRFRDPQQLPKFEGTLHAIHEGYECCSITATNASEDCLKLNVYTKQLNPCQPLPVVIVLHPGGLYLGSSKWMDPTFMLTKDIVLVTFNYRLGSLGYLNVGNAEIPGNAGFKDQVFALRWVQKFITNFGGNSQDITLMGYSAGALSVSLHLVSPMSKGLFQKAIIMSGSMPPQTKLPEGQQKYLAIRQAKRLNCSEFQDFEGINWELSYKELPDYKQVNDSKLLECFQRFSGMEIAQTLRQMFDFGKDNPIYLWLPIVEREFGQQRFLEQDFYVTLRNLKTIDIPLLMGYTNGEFCGSSRYILKADKLKAKLEENFDVLSPRIFMYESALKRKLINEKLLEHYFNKSHTQFSSADYDALCDLFSDALIRFGAHQTAEIVSRKGLVYFYEFVYQEKSKEIDEMFPQKQDRVEHMDDLQYLDNWSRMKNLSAKDNKIVELYTNFIYDFIKNGRISDCKAKPYPATYAVINETIEIKTGRNFENFEFWSELFKGDPEFT